MESTHQRRRALAVGSEAEVSGTHEGTPSQPLRTQDVDGIFRNRMQEYKVETEARIDTLEALLSRFLPQG